MGLEGRLRGKAKGSDVAPLFLCSNGLIFGGGVTGGVTKWGYILPELGLHFWGI